MLRYGPYPLKWGQFGNLGLGLGLGLTPSDGGGYNPVTALGSDLLGYWEANRFDLITQSGGLVSSWKDVVSGADALQAGGSAKPGYSPTGFNGAPCLTFDGVDDFLICTDPVLLALLPIGATPVEMWGLTQQDALAADATVRRLFAYGGENINARYSAHSGNGSQNVFNSFAGDGSAVAGSNASGFLGRSVTRSVFSANQVQSILNASIGTATPVVPATVATRIRLGASSAASPGGYWQGSDAVLIFTKSLSTDKATALAAWLNSRR